MVNTKTNIAAVAARAEMGIVARPTRTLRLVQRLPRMYGGSTRPPVGVRGKTPAQGAGASAAPMAVNFAVRFVPTVVTAVMITTAINPAMRPYSMAVTPDSSRTKRKRRVFMVLILDLLHVLSLTKPRQAMI